MSRRWPRRIRRRPWSSTTSGIRIRSRVSRRPRDSPNVYCKLSGLRRFDDPRPRVRLPSSLFGPGRLMFGSDWPHGLPDHTWKAALALFTQSIGAQTIEVREELLGGTAARVYGI